MNKIELANWLREIAKQMTEVADEIMQPLLPTMYSQRDPRWRYKRLGFGDTTIGDYGCLITSIAMALSWIQRSPIDPPMVNDALKRVNGYTGDNKNLVIWKKVQIAFPELVQLKTLVHCVSTPAPIATINQAIQHLDPIFVRIDMNLHRVGIQHHWLWLYAGNNEDGYGCHDPWLLPEDQRLIIVPPTYAKEYWNAARAIYSVAIFSRLER